MKPKCPCERCSCSKPKTPDVETKTITALSVRGMVDKIIPLQKEGWIISSRAEPSLHSSLWKVTLSRPKI